MALTPVFRNYNFFDDIFKDVDREFARMEQDMRTAMNRIAPRDFVSAGRQSLHDELAKIRDPIVTKEDGSKELCLKYDVAGFKPEEIKVTTKNGTVKVEATHEEKTDESRVFHHFERFHTLPKDTNADNLTSSVSKDGVLVLKAPVGTPALKQ